MSSTLEEIHRVKLVGSGDRVVVLSHGFGGSQEMWSSVTEHLVPHYKVLLYNLRGHGSSSAEETSASRYKSLHGFAEDLVAILAELGVEKCSYVGHSMSGMVGCLAAVARPELFDKIILVGASPRYLNDESSDYEGGFDEEAIQQLLAAIEEDYESWVKSFVSHILGENARETAVDEYAKMCLNMRPEFVRVIAETVFKSDFRGTLPLVSVPCHIVQTQEDPAVPMAVAEFLHNKLAGSTLHNLEVRGHLPHITSPDVFIRLLDHIL